MFNLHISIFFYLAPLMLPLFVVALKKHQIFQYWKHFSYTLPCIYFTPGLRPCSLRLLNLTQMVMDIFAPAFSVSMDQELSIDTLTLSLVAKLSRFFYILKLWYWFLAKKRDLECHLPVVWIWNGWLTLGRAGVAPSWHKRGLSWSRGCKRSSQTLADLCTLKTFSSLLLFGDQNKPCV